VGSNITTVIGGKEPMVATESTQGSNITTVIDRKEQMVATEPTQGSKHHNCGWYERIDGGNRVYAGIKTSHL
jgi:hypothetical protein